MAQTRKEMLGGIVGFVSGSSATGVGNADLTSQIAALEQTVPAATGAAASALSPVAHKTPPAGIVGLITDLVWLNQKELALEQSIRAADGLSRASRAFSAPMLAQLTQATKRGDDLSSAPLATDATLLAQRRAQYEELNGQMRQLSAAMLPLAKRRILLDAYKTNLTRWRSSVITQYRNELRRLIYRLVGIGIALVLVFAISALWGRATFRYVQDVRRRHQLLLMRRIVTLLVVALVIAVTFATDVGSLTTFAGLLTAGIAIALQDVILSLAGYFVIIGKYGIRIGDRVQIAHVTGDVVEVGLIWIYLMELEPRGSDHLPTGRIVEFPNAVAFDHSAGIFKQLPGTRFLWHEVAVVVPREDDYHATQARMLRAVDDVFESYRPAVEAQHREMERMLRISMDMPRPQSRLRIAPNGVEITVRYPVELQKGAEIDDRVTSVVTGAMPQPVAS
jgi:small-conductance mechanosensitive channel